MDYNFSDYKTTEEKKEEAKRDRKNNLFYPLIIAVIVAIIGPLLSIAITSAFQNKNTVKDLAAYFDSVDKNMEFEQALERIYEENENTKEENEKLKEENKKLKIEINNVSNRELTTNAESGKQDKETKIDLIESGVIYDGKYLSVIKASDDKTFSMGSDTFNKGFTIISDNYSLFGEGDGFALFDLKGEYSKLNFSVARVNRSDAGIEDATLKVYLDNNFIDEYALSGEKPPTKMTIDLNYANTLKLELHGNKIQYGFANCILEK